MLTTGDLDSIPLAFRRLVGVLVRCQSPSVASWLNIWSRSLIESRGEQLASSSQFAGGQQSYQECLLEEGGRFQAAFSTRWADLKSSAAGQL